ncbi:site-specific DNA-methyltransferase [Bacillus litorisediminis]|uniref:site-specific DNA-methyltransferase n=1 Tax=Bacillus litorisediminis TaxID=2922713 RepID=UPI001FAEAE67|nr:site-specific DNA-methyltransferase [Bacillus litorisediminis]
MVIQTKLITRVNTILREFQEYWIDGVLNKPKIIDAIKSYDSKLLKRLLDDEIIRNTYCENINGTIVFRHEEFIDFFRYKEYWNDSYTRFGNEIGLSIEGKHLKYNTDVVLDFPYKDTVLEGGMTKEDNAKNEIYYHNILAKEEIDILFSPKVLTNIKKISNSGVDVIETFDENENLILKGNNLVALYTLKQRFAGKIDLIYIDPPYNVKSSNNTFLYNNKYNRSTWLVFMQNRLRAAKDLLTPDGAMIIAIDENEQAYLGVLLDEVFPGYEKHLITIVHNPRGVQGTNFSYTNEFVYFIIPQGKKTIIDKKLSENEIQWSPLRNWGGESLRTDAKNCFYPIIVKDEQIVGFGEVVPDDVHPAKNEKIDGLIYIYPIDSNGVERKWRYARQSVEQIKHMLKCVKTKDGYDIQIGKDFGQYKTVWQDPRYDSSVYGKQLLNKLVPGNPFTFPKSVYAVYDCLYAVVGNKKDAKILDFFGGSGTTGHATMLLNKNDNGNRQYIIVEQMDYVESVIVERMKNLIIDEEFKNKDLSFVYAELLELNQRYIRAIDEVSTDKQLEVLINDIKDNAFLNFKVEIERITIKDEEFKSLSLEEKKKIVIDSLDQNQYYVSYSEIDDITYGISDHEKAFNRSFYEGERVGVNE